VIFEKAICFLPTFCSTFYDPPSRITHAMTSLLSPEDVPSTTTTLHFSPRPPRRMLSTGAHVRANPNRHVRSFVGGSQLLLCDFVFKTPEDGGRSTVALEARAHEEVPVASSDTDRDGHGTLRRS
jgi:hypothetical protein